MHYEKTLEALLQVSLERARQEQLKDEGRFLHTLSDDVSESYSLTCISEEVGEVARIVLNRYSSHGDDIDTSDEELRKELSHIAALAVAWMERYEH